jgi:bifunctional non-homologous end joining protein LigD
VIETALRLRELLSTEGLEPWPKVTGGKGLHVMAPVERNMDWPAAKAYTRRVAEQVAATAADRYTTSAALAKRPGRLFIDYLRKSSSMRTGSRSSRSPRPSTPRPAWGG